MALPGPAIDPEMLLAYRQTEYRVLADPGFILRVGEASQALFAAHRQRGVACSAVLTACNPRSRILDPAENAARQSDLARDIGRRALPFVPGIGQHPANGWPAEQSFLVFGIARAAARALAARWEQNGFIWSGADAVPQLILLG